MDNPASWIWVLIPLAAIGIAPFKMWLKIKERQIEAQSSLAAEKTAQYAAHVERIEQRLRVLEEIVTGKSDAILLDKNARIMYNKHNPGTFVLRDDLPPVKIQPFPLAFDKGEVELKLFIDNAISELQNNGEMNRIISRWEEEPNTFLRAAPPYKAE